jgi:hypothetical protein
MRNRWESGGDTDLDAPATLTERELRALKRRAGFGVPATLLACVAIGGLGWTLYSGPAGLEQVQELKGRVLSGVERTSDSPMTDVETREVRTPAPSSPADSSVAAAPAAGAADSSRGTPVASTSP